MSTRRREAPPERRIAALFDAIVPRYDLVNDLLSLGFDRWWWRRTVRALGGVSGGRVLDLGCGTGSLTVRLVPRFRVVGVDLSEGMLRAAVTRLEGRAGLVQGSAFALPFAPGAFDAVASAFVLRNLDDHAAAFAEMARVARRGSRLALVDITEPRGPVLRRLFDAYFGVAAPTLGRLSGHPDAYRYLVRSLEQLPPPDEVTSMLGAAGFARVRARSLAPGAVTLWTGVRS